MKPGEIAEFGIWMNGEETEEQLQHFKSVVVPEMIARTEKQHRVKLMNLRFVIKRPGEDRVPTVPKHIHGIDVRLMIAEVDVFAGPEMVERAQGITNDLDEKSLQTLRRVTRREHSKAHPGMPALSNKQCDAIIDRLGVEIIQRMLSGASVH